MKRSANTEQNGSNGKKIKKGEDHHCEAINFEKVKRSISDPTLWSCQRCSTTDHVLVCLTCGKIFCKSEKDHCNTHFGLTKKKHPLFMEINENSLFW